MCEVVNGGGMCCELLKVKLMLKVEVEAETAETESETEVETAETDAEVDAAFNSAILTHHAIERLNGIKKV